MPAFFVLSALLFPAVPLLVSRSDPVPVPDPVSAPAPVSVSAPARLRNACGRPDVCFVFQILPKVPVSLLRNASGGSYFRFVVRKMLDLPDCLPRNVCGRPDVRFEFRILPKVPVSLLRNVRGGSYFRFKYRKLLNLQEPLRRNVHSISDVRFVAKSVTMYLDMLFLRNVRCRHHLPCNA